MNRIQEKQTRLKRRIKRVAEQIKSRHPRPRLVVKRSNRFIWAQIIDDSKGVTVCAATTKEASFSGAKKNKEAAAQLGTLIAERAQEKGIKKVVLDRRGQIYHGRVASVAEAAREKGLEF